METSKKMLWSGRILSGLAIAFLTFDGVMKFFLHTLPPEMLADSDRLQFSIDKMPMIGTILLVCTLLYAIPRTAVLGAILLTGYLGGAISLHVRIDNPLFSHVLFPVYIGIFIWAGLVLRNQKLRSVLFCK